MSVRSKDKQPDKAIGKGARSTKSGEFNGVIALDVRDSTPDWDPYMPPKAKEGSPNIFFVLYDDTGLAAWSPFGGGINMPTLQKIADKGLRYTQWHTAALCSPTRSMLLTGRNHHLNGCASITEGANGFPGQHARIPDSCATIGQILQENGYSTFWVGKNHNVPETDIAAGSTRSQWPLAKGFDRFYGFIGGETNQWYPDLVEDNHFVELPEGHTPGFEGEGYHLSKDLADKAIQMLKDQKASHPSKPWYMWFCPGANHAPHQAPQEYIEKYWNDNQTTNEYFNFKEGYEAYRIWAIERMKEKDVLPKDFTDPSPINPLAGIMHAPTEEGADPLPIANPDDEVIPWDANLPLTKKEVFAKLMAVYAAFSEYTDAQIGRILDYLEQTGQLDNTVIIFAADNGASGEGSPIGTVNENKFFNGYPESDAENLKLLPKFGGPETYEHFPTGWAMATSTPFKMFKRYSQYSGGTCDPLVIAYKDIPVAERGGVRNQYHHATDIVPTILDICGLQMPSVYKGAAQVPLSGVSMRYTFENPTAKTTKKRQYYAMLGTRAIWEDGWKAVCRHTPLSGHGHFEQDEWELYHVDEDPAEMNNLGNERQHYPRLVNMVEAWFEEAEANWVLPLDDRSATEQLTVYRPTEELPRDVYVYYPGASPVPESVAANVRGCSFTIDADVDLTADSHGTIFAHGSRFGGHTLFVKEGRLYYVYNFLGIGTDETRLSWPIAAGHHKVSVRFDKAAQSQQVYQSDGNFFLNVTALPSGSEQQVDQKLGKAQVGKFTLCGDGLCVGYDSADAIVKDFAPESSVFRGGIIHSVSITPGKDVAKMQARVAAGLFSAD